MQRPQAAQCDPYAKRSAAGGHKARTVPSSAHHQIINSSDQLYLYDLVRGFDEISGAESPLGLRGVLDVLQDIVARGMPGLGVLSFSEC